MRSVFGKTVRATGSIGAVSGCFRGRLAGGSVDSLRLGVSAIAHYVSAAFAHHGRHLSLDYIDVVKTSTLNYRGL